jgi:hypothetical protein
MGAEAVADDDKVLIDEVGVVVDGGRGEAEDEVVMVRGLGGALEEESKDESKE